MIESGHIEEQAAAHALGALPADEAEQVDRHVDDCPPCKELLDDTHDAAALLALTVVPVRPPHHCKARLMSLIEGDAAVAPRRKSWLAEALPTYVAGTASQAARPGSLLPFWMMRATVSMALVALLAWNIQLQRQINQARMVQTMVVMDHSPSALMPQDDSSSNARARVFKGPSGTDAVLVIENLPPPPPGKVYQIWIANEHSHKSVQTFRVGDSLAQVIMHTPDPLSNYKWAMITIEDAGGSETPSETTVLFGDL
jgi:anti-sigma-K factor RskA